MLNLTELIGFGATSQFNSEIVGLTDTSTPSFASSCGNGVWTPTFNIADWISPELLQTGKAFTVVTKLSPCTGWAQYPTLTGAFVYGTNKTVQSPTVANKQFYMRIVYDAAAGTIQGYGFYAGDSSDFKQGKLYISDVVFPL
jgi:hypothetical protein